MLVRSPVLSTAFFAVGEHTPAEQLMLAVAFFEIATSARAAPAAPSTAATAAPIIHFAEHICRTPSQKMAKSSRQQNDPEARRSGRSPGLARAARRLARV